MWRELTERVPDHQGDNGQHFLLMCLDRIEALEVHVTRSDVQFSIKVTKQKSRNNSRHYILILMASIMLECPPPNWKVG